MPPKAVVTKKNIWKNYIKLPNFNAQCIFCVYKPCYVNISNFRIHVARHRKIWKYEEERKLTKWPGIYYRYLNKLFLQCIICDAKVLSTTESAKDHLSSHSYNQQLENSVSRSWPWKYCIQRDDFMVECKICHKNITLRISSYISLHIKTKHLDKLKNTQNTHATVDSSERALLKTGTISRSPCIVTKKHMWKYYVKLSDFKAQCMFCTQKYCYANTGTFRLHIARFHKEILTYEKERKSTKWLWMYFKYFDKLYSRCIICDVKIRSTFKSAENHLKLHFKQERENYINQYWEQKYWTIRDDLVVECKICHNNLSVTIRNTTMDSHTKKKHSNKLKNAQEPHDTVCSSKRVSLLETDTTPRPVKIVTKTNLWKYYVKLPDFKAQCRFCEKKYKYVSSSSFVKHIATQHDRISNYENEKKLKKSTRVYFKYLNKSQLQCLICDARVLSLSKAMENHSSSHSNQQREIYMYRDWTRKYYTQKDDFVVECKICNNNLTFTIKEYMNSHMKTKHLDKLKNAQETHGTVNSSERVSSLKTD